MPVKLVVFVPLARADALREALGRAGAGRIGRYAFCSFSSRGQGRFLPLEGATPAVGTVGLPEVVDEERIEVLVDDAVLDEVLSALRRVHPYEEPAFEVYPLLALG